MQIKPYQGPWGNYAGNGGKLTACRAREVIRVMYTGRFIFIIVPLSALIVAVLTRQLDVVRVVRQFYSRALSSGIDFQTFGQDPELKCNNF